MRQRYLPALVVLGGSFLTSCSDLGPLDNQLEKIGYTRNNPPRSDHGAGWVFQFARNISGQTVTQTVCSRLFDDNDSVKLQSTATVLPNVKANDKGGVSFAVELLQAIKGVNGSLSSEFSQQKDIGIHWGPTSIEDIALEGWYTKSGSVAISPECKSILRKIKARKGLDTVFIAQEALHVESFSYTFRRSSKFDASAQAAWKGWLQGKGSVTTTGDDEVVLTIDQPIIIAQKIFALKDIIFDDAQGSAFAKVEADPVSAETLLTIQE